MEKKFEVPPPTMPNYARFKQKAGLKQDGCKITEGFPIADFTEEEAKEYAELMRNAFMEHYRTMQANKK